MIFASAFLIDFQSCTPFRLLPDKQDKLAGLEKPNESQNPGRWLPAAVSST